VGGFPPGAGVVGAARGRPPLRLAVGLWLPFGLFLQQGFDDPS
jgi:hypothetical protein